LALLFL